VVQHLNGSELWTKKWFFEFRQTAKLIDKELTSFLYKIGKPLSLFDDDCWVQFFKKNFGYMPPSSWAISRPLLDEAYEDVKRLSKDWQA
jgi:hypothetical protein